MKDIYGLILSYQCDKEILKNSTINNDWYHEHMRKKIIDKQLYTRLNKTISYLNVFKDKQISSFPLYPIFDILQELSDGLLKNYSFKHYESKKTKYIKVKKYVYTTTLYDKPRIITRHPYVSCVYRCSTFMMYHIKNNLTVKALIY